MPVAAVLGAAVIGAGASIYSGSKAAKAQKNAANQSTALQQAQDAEARRQYDLGRADLAPYRDQGVKSLAQLATGTADGGEFNRNFTLADFNKDPGYDFRQGEGMKGVERSAAARGGILSGGALKAIARYNSEFASGEYGKAYDRFNNDNTSRFNRLSALAGTGQTAVAGGNAAGADLTRNLQIGVNNTSNHIADAANARASSYVNTGTAIGSAAGQIGNYFALKDLYKTPAPGGGGYNPRAGKI